jgi:hypothetical protein
MVLQFPPSDDQPSPRTGASKLKYKVVVGVGGLAGLFGIGSTLAANISLNNGGAVEFGQGVAQTAACDDDGFTVTPITSYDNAHSMFRLDKVQVSGLNLTPVGTTTDGGGLYGTAEERAANAGKYWDDSLSRWRNTCDNVVLDFKAYTNNPEYANYTQDGYAAPTTSIASPVMWSQYNGSVARVWDGDTHTNSWNPGFAVIFDSTNRESNYATGSVQGSIGNRVNDNTYLAEPGIMNVIDGAGLTTSNASFSFGSFYSNYDYNAHQNYDFRPDAATISKITVQSMKYFPANYMDDRYEYAGSDPRVLPVAGLSLLP